MRVAVIAVLVMAGGVARAEPPSFAGSPPRIRRVMSTMLCNNIAMTDGIKQERRDKLKNAPMDCANPKYKIQCMPFVEEIRDIDRLLEHGTATTVRLRQTLREMKIKPIVCAEMLMAQTVACLRANEGCEAAAIQVAVSDFKEAAEIEQRAASATEDE